MGMGMGVYETLVSHHQTTFSCNPDPLSRPSSVTAKQHSCVISKKRHGTSDDQGGAEE